MHEAVRFASVGGEGRVWGWQKSRVHYDGPRALCVSMVAENEPFANRPSHPSPHLPTYPRIPSHSVSQFYLALIWPFPHISILIVIRITNTEDAQRFLCYGNLKGCWVSNEPEGRSGRGFFFMFFYVFSMVEVLSRRCEVAHVGSVTIHRAGQSVCARRIPFKQLCAYCRRFVCYGHRHNIYYVYLILDQNWISLIFHFYSLNAMFRVSCFHYLLG